MSLLLSLSPWAVLQVCWTLVAAQWLRDWAAHTVRLCGVGKASRLQVWDPGRIIPWISSSGRGWCWLLKLCHSIPTSAVSVLRQQVLCHWRCGSVPPKKREARRRKVPLSIPREVRVWPESKSSLVLWCSPSFREPQCQLSNFSCLSTHQFQSFKSSAFHKWCMLNAAILDPWGWTL